MKEIIEFLKESNNIEDEWDDDSLAQAFYAWDYIINQDNLSLANIKETHAILMKNHFIQSHEKGEFRERPVYVGGREGKPHYAISNLLTSWLENCETNLNKALTDEELEQAINENHIAYEAIHPFIDGNGRTGRIFLNWQRVKLGLPILIIKEAEKQNYYDWFR